jgi:GT2 family glycosyltransferase
LGFKNFVKQVLIGRQDRRYELLLEERRRLAYPEWLEAQERSKESPEKETQEKSGIKEGSDDQITSDICIFYSTKGRLEASGAEELRRCFGRHREALLVYADEDVWTTQGRRSPWFKPEWSPETFRSFFYFGSLVAVRKELMEQSGLWKEGSVGRVSGTTEEGRVFLIPYEHYVDEQELMQAIEKLVCQAGGYTRGCQSIFHLSKILFHCNGETAQEAFRKWRPVPSGIPQKLFGPNIFLPKKHEERDALSAGEGFSPKVSVIIPSKDQPEVLGRVLHTLRNTCEGLSMEVILVDNGSSARNKETIEKLLQDLREEINITYYYKPMEFHFSVMCNLGAAEARGELLLFLNDDVELCCTGWMEKMAGYAAQEHVGAVGLKLYYPDSRRIQHVGVTNTLDGPMHKLQSLLDDRCYYFGKNLGDSNYLAVTGACLMVEKAKFQEAGGFPEDLAVAFNDVDLCFSLYEAGYHNVAVNTLYAYHHESLSRGKDEDGEKQARLTEEWRRLYERHPALKGRDPYYPKGLDRRARDTKIWPEYLTAGNDIQHVGWRKSGYAWKRCRQDACLMLGVEICEGNHIQGYGVVLGDDNACYKKVLLLGTKGREEEERKSGACMVLPLAGQYRPDLSENLPDQRNVAFCGFDVEWEPMEEGSFAKGVYRIGMAARNQVTGLKLCSWSERYVVLDGGGSGGNIGRRTVPSGGGSGGNIAAPYHFGGDGRGRWKHKNTGKLTSGSASSPRSWRPESRS